MAAKKKKELAFEAGMQELEALVDRLSGSELPLDEAIVLYEQGKALAGELNRLLAAQQKRIEMIDPDTGEIEAFVEKND
ncbi:MAG: exodeoxyribonuclease VII small subunit [Clostridia bacterium]|nr:exodeoxyribonuclease VII small subunit [Clostridia bacterium]